MAVEGLSPLSRWSSSRLMEAWVAVLRMATRWRGSRANDSRATNRGGLKVTRAEWQEEEDGADLALRNLLKGGFSKK